MPQCDRTLLDTKVTPTLVHLPSVLSAKCVLANCLSAKSTAYTCNYHHYCGAHLLFTHKLRHLMLHVDTCLCGSLVLPI